MNYPDYQSVKRYDAWTHGRTDGRIDGRGSLQEDTVSMEEGEGGLGWVVGGWDWKRGAGLIIDRAKSNLLAKRVLRAVQRQTYEVYGGNPLRLSK